MAKVTLELSQEQANELNSMLFDYEDKLHHVGDCLTSKQYKIVKKVSDAAHFVNWLKEN